MSSPLQDYVEWAFAVTGSPIIALLVVVTTASIPALLNAAFFFAAARNMSTGNKKNQWVVMWALLFRPGNFTDRGKRYRLCYLVTLPLVFGSIAFMLT